MKKILYFMAMFGLWGCGNDNKTVVSCEGEIINTNINMIGETAKMFDCIDEKNKTRCSVVVMKDRISMGCNEIETAKTKMLCMSLNDGISGTENTQYSCELNSSMYTTKCEYESYEDNTGKIVCVKSRTLFGVKPLID